ncbi:lysR family regulatory protein [Paramyrothecium foliicola]|nr:lysR family regulatory protein [Paramyrothecium foliicola]
MPPSRTSNSTKTVEIMGSPQEVNAQLAFTMEEFFHQDRSIPAFCLENGNSQRLSAQALTPSGPDYGESEGSYWSNTAKVGPAYIIRPSSAEQGSESLVALAKAEQKFAVRSGGLAPLDGTNNIRNGVTLDPHFWIRLSTMLASKRLVVVIGYIEALEDIVVSGGVVETRGDADSPAWADWNTLPMIKDTRGKRTMLDMVLEIALASNQYDTWSLITVSNDKRILAKANELHTLLVQDFADRSFAKGGNVLGLERNTRDGVLILISTKVKTGAHEAFAHSKVLGALEELKAFAKNTDTGFITEISGLKRTTMGLFSSTSQGRAPNKVATDEVVPLGQFDDTMVFRSLVMKMLCRFDDVLDAEKLHAALVKLLSRPGWRKMGGRLRENADGGLEYHVPVEFSTARPAVAFRHAQHSMSIRDHPIASKMPRSASKEPAVVASPDDFTPLMSRDDDPRSIKDYLRSDRPQISLRVESFEDATLVSLAWPHTLMDAGGRKDLLEAWQAVLEGRDDDVKPLCGAAADPLATLGQQPGETFAMADKRLSGLQMIMYALRVVLDVFWQRAEEGYMLCLPSWLVQDLHKEAVANLPELPGGEKPFVSEGDAVCAWLARASIPHISPRSTQTIAIANPLGLRYRFRDLLPATHAYPSNAIIVSAVALLPARDVHNKPLGYVASEIRRSLAEQGSREQIDARWALERSSKFPFLLGDVGMHILTFSNVVRADFFATDFSAAVVGRDAGDAGPTHKIGRPSYVQPAAFSSGIPRRNAFSIIGKDAEGNYWMTGYFRKGLWDQVIKTSNLARTIGI